MTTADAWFRNHAALGSTIQTTFSNGTRVRVQIDTPAQCALANELIDTGRWQRIDGRPAATEETAP